MDFLEYIKGELLILIPVLYFIGIAIKKSKVKDNYIPFILGAISILLCALWVLSTSVIATFQDGCLAIFTAIVQGVLIAGASVYANQMYKQLNTKNDEE